MHQSSPAVLNVKALFDVGKYISFVRIQNTNRDKDDKNFKSKALWAISNSKLLNMARIAGVDLPDYKRVDIALTYIYGIGRSNVNLILQQAAVAGSKRVKELSEEEIGKVQKVIEEKFKVEGDLKTEVAENIKRLKEIGSYRGIRHIKGLPVRGQRTRSNARTKRGKRKTVGALKKEVRAQLEQVQKPTDKGTTK